MPKNAFCSDIRSHTLIHAHPENFENFEIKNLEKGDFPEGLFKLKHSSHPTNVGAQLIEPVETGLINQTPIKGTITSSEIKTKFEFDELIISANAVLKEKNSIIIEAQVRDKEGNWSDWYNLGIFRTNGQSESFKNQTDEFCKVDVDTLKLSEPSQYFRYRISIESSGEFLPVLKMVAATYSRASLKPSESFMISMSKDFKPIKLYVPQYSQMLQQIKYTADICSPVSLAMVLNYYNIDDNPIEVASKVYDKTENIYGNWIFNIIYAGTKKLYSYVTRMNTLAEAESMIGKGFPIIASITFGPKELKNSPLNNTKGHLVVIKGFDKKGDVIVNDPAAPDETSVERIYDRKEFVKAWIKNKLGTSYVIMPRKPKE